MEEYGGLVVSGGPGAGSIAVTTAFGQVTGFNALSEAYSQQAGREGVIPDLANNRILVQAGRYRVDVSLSLLEAASNNKVFTLGVSKNGQPPTDLVTEFTGIGAANSSLDPSLTGILNVTTGDCSQQPYVGPAVPSNIPTTPLPTQQPPVAAVTLVVKGSAAETLVLRYGQFTLTRLND